MSDDPTRERILDAALAEAASGGLRRLTVEDVVRRSGLGRMTVYRRFARRDDIVAALEQRETARFLATVHAAIDGAPDGPTGIADAFVAAVGFVRAHPLLRRLADTEPGSVFDGSGDLLRRGREFIAAAIDPGTPSPEIQRVADVLARLFLTYVAIPPDDPDPADDAALRRFAADVVTPMIERAATASAARA